MNTTAQPCQRPGCVNDEPVHHDHTWTEAAPARVGRCDGNVYVYAMVDDDRTQFPVDEIFITLYPW